MTTDTFKVSKNINESFSITLPSQFVPNNTNLVKFDETVAIDVTSPSFTTNSDVAINMSIGLVVTPTTVVTGATRYVYSTSNSDCNIATNDSTSFSKTRDHLFFGQNNTSRYYKTWMPFMVNIAQGTTITSAKLVMTSQRTGSHSNVRVKLGCDSRDDCVTGPTNYADLNSRSMTAAYTTENPLPSATIGMTYLYDVTDAVQEIINRTGWVSDQTLAILSMDAGSTGNAFARFASFEDDTYTPSFPITGMSYSGTTVTLNCESYFAEGSTITVYGVDLGYGTANIDGNWTCSAGTNPLQIVFTVSSPPTGTTPQSTSHGYAYTTPITVTGMSYSGNTVTLTATNFYTIGTKIHVVGVNSGYTVTNIDGDWVCKTGTSGSQVVFDVTNSPSGTTPQVTSNGTLQRCGIPMLVITL
jgi:hypothetical protein